MTVVPAAFQLTGWIPAWWRGSAGGDDLLELVGPAALDALGALRTSTVALTAYCPELGVGVLPGPATVNRSAVATGQAVILHAAHRAPSHVLVPHGASWTLLAADPARPPDLDLRSAASDLAQAVVAAEHAIRETSARFDAAVPRASVRPLPPHADPERKGLLVRAVRLWTAVAAIPVAQRTSEVDQVLTAAARATLAAYMEPQPVHSSLPERHSRRRV